MRVIIREKDLSDFRDKITYYPNFTIFTVQYPYNH